MSENIDDDSVCFPALKTLLDSFKIFLRNPKLFLSIFAFTTLPLSLLIFSLSLSSHPLRSQIYNLESVSTAAPTRFEARHVFKESRQQAFHLFLFSALFGAPIFAFSLIAAVSTVSSAAVAFSGKRPSFESATAAVKTSWTRPAVTAIYAYVIILTYAHIPRNLALLFGSEIARWLVMAFAAALEVYLMAVLSLGLVVSITEDRFGLDAIRVGSDTLKGRRVCGCALSGFLVLVSACIGWELDGGLMDGQDLSGSGWSTVVMGYWEKAGLVCLFGLVVLWSYAVTTVFYCECKRRHVVVDRLGEEMDV